jgi:hypothetical protein
MAISRLKPKLMAIGDSLPQGCRSLTVKASYCGQSWPARIAAEQGWAFVAPDHPWEVLFDLEREIRLLDPVLFSPATLAMIGLPKRIKDNLQLWLGPTARSRSQSFDNVAIAGSEVHDLYSRTSASYGRDILELTEGDLQEQIDNLANLHVAINGRYVLNPQQIPEFNDFSPLDWVEARQPETLLVQSGHNHGLFMLGFQGKPTNITAGDDPQGRDFFQQWEVVAKRIADLPDTVKRIVVVLLPKVGAVAALLPTSSARVDGYSEAYVPRLLPSSSKLAGNLVAKADREIQAVNERIREIFQKASAATNTENRLHFIDTFRKMDEIDYKNHLSPDMRIKLNDSMSIDNRYLDGALDFSSPQLSRLKAGGYLSVDGMHPSGVGYADLASKVMDELNLPHDRDRLLQQAFQEDQLLSNYPLELDAITRYIDLLRPLNSANWFVAESPNRLRDNTHLSQALKLLSKPFVK